MASSLRVSFIRLLTLLALGLALLSACTAPSQQDEPAANSAGGDAALDSEDAQDDVALDDAQPDIDPDTLPDEDSPDMDEDSALDDVGDTCDFIGDYLRSHELEDCGSISTPMGGDACWDTQLSCFQSALHACRPAMLHHLQEGFPDGGDTTFIYVIDGSRGNDGGCLVGGFMDQRSLDELPEHRALYQFRCEDFVVSTEDTCTLVTVANSCPGLETLGSCADLYANCTVCN